MIAAAIVCAAVVSQAATFNWTVGAVQKGPGIDLANLAVGHYGNSSTVNVGNTAYSKITWTASLYLDNGTLTDELLDKAVTISLNKFKIDGLSSDVVFAPASASDPDNEVDYKIVITGTYKDANEKVWTITADDITGTAKYSSLSTPPLKISSDNVTGWTVSTSAVPEPTSAMLLLLGVAGLALRRRRA